MGRCDALFPEIWKFLPMNFLWIGAYVDCGCAIADEIPLFNVSGWKVFREF